MLAYFKVPSPSNNKNGTSLLNYFFGVGLGSYYPERAFLPCIGGEVAFKKDSKTEGCPYCCSGTQSRTPETLNPKP